MNDIINVGPFLIKYTLLVSIISGLIGYLFLILRIQKMNMDKRLITDIVLGTVMIYVIIWKFGDLLFNPSLLWESPLSILYLNGTEKTTIIAIVSSVLYLSYKIKKYEIPFYPFLDLLPYGFLPFFLVYNLAVPFYGHKTNLPWGISISSAAIKYQPINYYLAAIITCLMIFLVTKKGKIKPGMYFSRTVVTLGVSGLLLSFLANLDVKIIGLTYGQLLSIILLLFGTAMNKKEHYPAGNERTN